MWSVSLNAYLQKTEDRTRQAIAVMRCVEIN
jgi:hypothetical protein